MGREKQTSQESNGHDKSARSNQERPAAKSNSHKLASSATASASKDSPRFQGDVATVDEAIRAEIKLLTKRVEGDLALAMSETSKALSEIARCSSKPAASLPAVPRSPSRHGTASEEKCVQD